MSRTEAFVRRSDFVSGDLTPDEKIRMDDHARLWIRRAFRTDPIDTAKIAPAILDLYAAAGLKQPRVVLVPSPLVMAVAGGFAAALLHVGKPTGDATGAATRDATRAATWAATGDATRAATRDATGAATGDATGAATGDATRAATWDATGDATGAATGDATRAATWDATGAATRDATRAATWDATGAATRDATRAATWAATGDATRAATWDATGAATGDATRAATWDATGAATWAATWDATGAATGDGWAQQLALEIGGSDLAPLMLSCANNWGSCTDYGNMWAEYPAYLSAFRDVLGLQLPVHEKFAAFERAAIEGSLRFMHPEFCMVCDFPEVLLVDEQSRPHCGDGPSHRWRDGWSLYHWHGVRLPEYIIERPHEISVALIEKEPNAEIRRAMIERYGSARYLLDSGAAVIARDHVGILYRKDLAGDPEPMVMVRVLNSTPEPDGVMTRDEAIAVFGDAARAAINSPADSRFKEYMIRVPPTTRTAQEAVAWTFGLKASDYAPELET